MIATVTGPKWWRLDLWEAMLPKRCSRHCSDDRGCHSPWLATETTSFWWCSCDQSWHSTACLKSSSTKYSIGHRGILTTLFTTNFEWSHHIKSTKNLPCESISVCIFIWRYLKIHTRPTKFDVFLIFSIHRMNVASGAKKIKATIFVTNGKKYRSAWILRNGHIWVFED